MSIMDSVSEHERHVVGVASLAEIGLRVQYEALSNIFWERPTPELNLALDKLLEVIEDVKAWRLDTLAEIDKSEDA